MTTRWTKRKPVEPREVAAAVPESVVAEVDVLDYRVFFENLCWVVEDVSGSSDTGLVMRVAELLGVSPAHRLESAFR